jgi:bisphosphoglycerate-independent phosphoglycerate mutase (AlkP superfamily)
MAANIGHIAAEGQVMARFCKLALRELRGPELTNSSNLRAVLLFATKAQLDRFISILAIQNKFRLIRQTDTVLSFLFRVQRNDDCAFVSSI